MSRWFRFYDDAINDPKILRLPDKTFRAWIGILCVASKSNGVLPSTEHLAFYLRVKPQKVAVLLAELVAAGLIDRKENGFEPHNWSARQFKADKSEDTKKDSYVYFIGHAWAATLKIGFSKNPWARVAELQTAQPNKLHLLAAFRCKSNSEIDLHDILREFRKNGEWFDLPTSIYVAVSNASDRSIPYEVLVAELRDLLRSATTEAETEQIQNTDQSRKKETREVALSREDAISFEKFWDQWPNKVGKPAALKAYRSAVNRSSHAEIIAGVVNYIRDKPPDRPWLNPATFLNQNRWEDQPATVQGSPNGRRTVQQAADDLLEKLRAFDEPAPSNLCDGTGENAVRLLSSR